MKRKVERKRKRVRRNDEESENWDALDLVEDWMAGGGQQKR
jgi:hypothetical protein